MRNVRLLIAYGALRMAMFPIPIITLFWKDHIGLTLQDIFLLQAIFGAVTVVLEFPSGYVADRIGYKKALLIAAGFWILGWTAYCFGHDFLSMVLAETLLGVGLAFHSGSDSALLYNSLPDPSKYVKYEGRMRGASQASEAVSSAGGGWFYSLSPRLPFWLMVPTAALGFVMVLFLKEKRVRQEKVGHGSRLRKILRTSLVENRRLSSAIWLGVILSLSSFFIVWLLQPYMQSGGVPTVWFGPIWAAANLWVALMSLSSYAVAKRFGVNVTLFGCILMIAAGYGFMAMTGSWWGFSFYFLIMTCRGWQNPLLLGEVQKQAPKEDRASVLSLKSMIFRLSFVVFGPLLGAFVDIRGMSQGLLLTGAGCTLLSLLGLWAFSASAASKAARE